MMLKVKQPGLRGNGPWEDKGPHPEEGLFLHILRVPLAGSQPPLRIPPQKLGVGGTVSVFPCGPQSPSPVYPGLEGPHPAHDADGLS